jgi:hypothetical protein
MDIPPLYLNENVPLRLTDMLLQHGIHAEHTIKVGNQGVSDEMQLEYAANKGYILVTHNRKDFRQLHKLWIKKGKFHNGIIVMKHDEPEILAIRIKLFFEKIYPILNPPFCISPPSL